MDFLPPIVPSSCFITCIRYGDANDFILEPGVRKFIQDLCGKVWRL